MGGCTSKPSSSVKPNPYAPKDAVLQNDDSTPAHPGKSPVRSSPAVKASPFFPFYTPSPARHRRNKSRDGGGGESKSVTSTPLRQLARAFHPPSPARHIRDVLRRRKEKKEAALPAARQQKEEEEREEVGLDKRFGFSKELQSRIELGEEIGRGHFGYTCSAKFKKGELKDQEVAVKVIPKSKMTSAISIEDVRREVKILRALSGHQNLVQFYDAFEDNANVYIVMELCGGGELLDRILARGGKYSEDDAKVEVLVLISLVILELSYAFAPISSYQWVVSYSQRFILGGNKQVIVINDMFPGPILNATANDIIVVNIFNNLPEPFLMTWNGLQLRKNSWQDGVRGTNCPILPGTNWTYRFQVKDQIGSYFYFPTLLLQKAAGGYGAIRIYPPELVPVPFPKPDEEYDILIGDWFYLDHTVMRASLDAGHSLPNPDGILFNGRGPEETFFAFEPGKTYRLRISNVGLKTCLNFRIQDHDMLLVETEGTYVQKRVYSSLDIHVGQSYSILVTAKTDPVGIYRSYYIFATARFTDSYLGGIALIRYPGSPLDPVGQGPLAPALQDFGSSVEQALSIRMDLNVGAARSNPQGSYHYGRINVTRTIILHNDVMLSSGKLRYTINGVSFVYPETPLKLVDHFQLNDTIIPGMFPVYPSNKTPTLGTSVVDIHYKDFIHIVFQNPLFGLESYHIDGYNFFVVGYGFGAWSESKKAGYNLVDAVSRSTVQVYPYSWTAILIAMDNQGMWNVRSQKAEQWYLGQELYMRVKGEGEEDPSTIPVRDENPIPGNVIRCGKVR